MTRPYVAGHDPKRIEHIRQRRARGETLAIIARDLGVSRERVRQIAEWHGIEKGFPYTLDQILDLCRRAASKTAARKEVGAGYWDQALDMLAEAGHWPALVRLWMWRQRRARAIPSDELIAALQREAQRLGHTPGLKDMNAPGSLSFAHSVYAIRFGSIRAAQIAAGLIPNRRGGRHGHSPLQSALEPIGLP